jgi:two-component system response regulator
VSNGPSRPLSILLVEDNPADVRLAEIALEDAHVQTTFACVPNGEAAIAFLRKEASYRDAPTPDLVLLDLNLPRKSGYEVLGEIRRDPALARIPTIVLSGSPYESETLRRYGVDPRCYLVKPLEYDALRLALACFPQLAQP